VYYILLHISSSSTPSGICLTFCLLGESEDLILSMGDSNNAGSLAVKRGLLILLVQVFHHQLDPAHPSKSPSGSPLSSLEPSISPSKSPSGSPSFKQSTTNYFQRIPVQKATTEQEPIRLPTTEHLINILVLPITE
jgi:hypothetical protein